MLEKHFYTLKTRNEALVYAKHNGLNVATDETRARVLCVQTSSVAFTNLRVNFYFS